MINLIFHRDGFANNSSSSHSIIFSRVWPTRSVSVNSPDAIVEDPYFGWERFALTSKQDKADYFAAQVKSFVNSKIGIWVQGIVELSPIVPLRVLLPELQDRARLAVAAYDYMLSDIKTALPPFEMAGGVDHQSCINFPVAHGSSTVHRGMVKKLYELLVTDPYLVILGGNDNGDGDDDNEDGTPPLNLHRLGVEPLTVGELSAEQEAVTRLVIQLRNQQYSCRKIDDRDAYVLSTKDGGTLSVYSFDGLPITKLDVPYLVDIKLTNTCPYGCEFCYQGSDSSRHTSESQLKYDTYDLLDSLSQLGVMEVAIGGGEPTLFPYITDVLGRAIACDLKVGITTKNYSKDFWADATFLNNDKTRPHSIAFSVHSIEDAKSLVELEDYINRGHTEHAFRHISIVAQIVVGVMNEEEFYRVCRYLASEYVGMTFLGYKTNGRGASFTPNMTLDDFMRVLGEFRSSDRMRYVPIGVDSTIAIACKEQLKSLGVEENLLTANEGAYTCYVDVPNRKMGPSSFCEESKMFPFPHMHDSVVFHEIFKTF